MIDVIASTETFTSGNYTFTKWSDGSITIEQTAYPFTNDATLERVALPAEQLADLVTFLTKTNG